MNVTKGKISAGFAMGLLALFIGFGSTQAMAVEIGPVQPQPEADALVPGLAVDYIYGDYHDIDELYQLMATGTAPGVGSPLPALNYRTSEGKNVLTTKFQRFVGAHINGFIKFPAEGAYSLLVTSNDGVRFQLGGQMIWEDPDIHPDRESDPIEVNVVAPGWVALDVGYFQRKGSSALILKWKAPGAADYVVVPAEAYAHNGAK